MLTCTSRSRSAQRSAAQLRPHPEIHEVNTEATPRGGFHGQQDSPSQHAASCSSLLASEPYLQRATREPTRRQQPSPVTRCKDLMASRGQPVIRSLLAIDMTTGLNHEATIATETVHAPK
jgi:hypothetical protein